MSQLIILDQQSFNLEVRHTLDDPYFPTTETIKMMDLAKEVRDQLKEFIDTKHEPKVKALLDVIKAFNDKHNPELNSPATTDNVEKKSESVTVSTVEPVSTTSLNKKKAKKGKTLTRK